MNPQTPPRWCIYCGLQEGDLLCNCECAYYVTRVQLPEYNLELVCTNCELLPEEKHHCGSEKYLIGNGPPYLPKRATTICQ